MLRLLPLIVTASFWMAPRVVQAQYGSPPPPGYGQPPPNQGGYASEPQPAGHGGGYPQGAYAAPVPPPPQKPDEGFEMPAFSVRADPLNWLIEGRLGLELEAELWKFVSVELVPVFVVNSEPPLFNWSGREDTLTQHSNGLGALSGTSIGLGFWLNGKPFEGAVLRAIFTNYGFTYRAEDDAGTIDEVSHTERQVYGFFGTMNRWGAFTLATGIGLGVELNKESRCPAPYSDEQCDDDELLIKVDRRSPEPTVHDLNGWLHPVQLMGRLSLGVTID